MSKDAHSYNRVNHQHGELKLPFRSQLIQNMFYGISIHLLWQMRLMKESDLSVEDKQHNLGLTIFKLTASTKLV